MRDDVIKKEHGLFINSALILTRVFSGSSHILVRIWSGYSHVNAQGLVGFKSDSIQGLGLVRSWSNLVRFTVVLIWYWLGSRQVAVMNQDLVGFDPGSVCL